MSSGLAPRLPVTTSTFELIQDYEALVAQNLKMLILTNPGERIMDINFGVGMRKYLFEMNDDITYATIASKIRNQVGRYLSFVAILKIDFKTPEDNPDLLPYTVRTTITFKIVPLQVTSLLQIDTNTN